MDRFNLSAIALRRGAVTLFAMLAIAGAGVWSYLSLGRAEDPPFTIKQMVIVTAWPGASADEVTRQVTDRIERKLEELPDLDFSTSYSVPGRSVVTVSLLDSTPPAGVPELWYQVRKKIGDIASTFPAGVQGPAFNDEFGDVYGNVYAITGEGFSLPQLRHVAEDVREAMLSVPDVGKVDLLGLQDERIYVDISHRKLAQLGLTLNDVIATVQRENAVVASGFVDTPQDRIQLHATSSMADPRDLLRLPVKAGDKLLQLGDFATVTRGTQDPPESLMRVDGKPALGIAVSMRDGGNILTLGRALDAKLAAIAPTLPLGVRIARVDDQPQVVARDVGDFQDSFLEALGIVLLVSFVTLGWRTGIVVAISVPLVLAGVLVGMRILGIDLQRISLGAMIIALGLLVDDAIIAVEMMVVKMEQGWDRMRAGAFAWTSTAFPMLTGTLVTAAGYLPIGIAQSSTGEYTRDIFRVVGLALMLSWFVAVLFVPYLGAKLLPEPKHRMADPGEVYDTALYRRFRRVIAWCIRRRWIVIGVTVLAFFASLGGFALIPQQFFPSSDRMEVVVDVRGPEGASFQSTDAAVRGVEAVLREQKGVVNYAAYIGTGAPRFFLASSPELDQANYAQIVVNTADVASREALLRRLQVLADDAAKSGTADLRLRPSRLELGPPVGYPVQFRVQGPDPSELRHIAGDLQDLLRGDARLRNISNSWGNPGLDVQLVVDQDKARYLGVSSSDVANLLQTLLQGTMVTNYRENTDLIPVLVRATAAERQDLQSLADVALPSANGHAVPLGQIARIGPGLEEPIIYRRNRLPVLTVRADIADATQPAVITAAVMPKIDALRARLPAGYRIDTGGAVEESAKGQASVNAGLPVMVIAMLGLLMLQLQSFRLVALVVATAPLGLIGVAAALLATGQPFGFVAMLGCIALAGIIMRNAVILVDQIRQDLEAGASAEAAIIEATVRRARPILLTAAAAILALVPLALSAFWGPMAVAIMGGLLGATVLTLFFLPALYAATMRGGVVARVKEGQGGVAPLDPPPRAAALGTRSF
jgi:multidrug efflux pump